MSLRLVIASLLAAGAHAFAPAPIRWGGDVDRRIVLAPASMGSASMSAVQGPQELTIRDLTGAIHDTEVPYFTAKPDSTISWDAKHLCIEASGFASGDRVQLNRCTGKATQTWTWLPWGPLQLHGTSQCLDAVDNGPIELRECAHGAADSWTFERPLPMPEHSGFFESSHHVMASLIAVAVLGFFGLSAQLYRLQKRARTFASGQGRMPDGSGVCLTAPLVPAAMALSPLADDLQWRRQPQTSHRARSSHMQVETASPELDAANFGMEEYNEKMENMRLEHLEEQAMSALKLGAENFTHAVFPNALIAGDVVITHLLHRLGYLKSGKVKVMVVDTFHLFPETLEFLKVLEKEYDFKAEVFCAEGVPCFDKAAFDKKYGANLWKEDIEQYDKVCKVEPFQRGLKTLETDCMINGRTRWQGFERAYISLFENAPIAGGMAKANPLAYWTLEDTFNYFKKYRIPYHPLHEKGYPSIGDAKDTIPVPDDGSVTFKDYQFQGDKKQWLDYACERKGRFVGLANKDGSTKTECGIHVEGAERTFDRDLWETSAVKALSSPEEMDALIAAGKPAVVVTYAPWCKFCQAMEEEFEKLAGEVEITVAKFRGDEQREYVEAKLNTQSFPTVNVVTPDMTVVKYESEARTVDSFKEFIGETLGNVPAAMAIGEINEFDAEESESESDAEESESESESDAEEYPDIPEPPIDLRERRQAFQRVRETEFKVPRNTSMIDVARGKSSEKVPVWAMRQAGRYLPEFRQIRNRHSFFKVCETPKLATEVTLQPLRRFPDLDAVIIFSDILVIPVAMGMECEMRPKEGPVFKTPLEFNDMRSYWLEDLDLVPNIEDKLGYVFDAIHWTYLQLDGQVPIIGFAGAPWTMFCYMVEGKGSSTWNNAKRSLHRSSLESMNIMLSLTNIIIEYLIGQYDAGASILQVFDTNAGELPPNLYERYCVGFLKKIARDVKEQRPKALMTIFAKDADPRFFAESEYDVVGVSWKQSPADVRKACPSKVLQGNMDPVVLYGDDIEEYTKKMMEEFGPGGHIANLGHGMLPDHEPESLERYIKAVKQHGVEN